MCWEKIRKLQLSIPQKIQVDYIVIRRNIVTLNVRRKKTISAQTMNHFQGKSELLTTTKNSLRFVLAAHKEE